MSEGGYDPIGDQESESEIPAYTQYDTVHKYIIVQPHTIRVQYLYVLTRTLARVLPW